MTKTISIYAAQILLGMIAIAAGYAKVTGTGLMVQQFQTLGLGQGFLWSRAAPRSRPAFACCCRAAASSARCC